MEAYLKLAKAAFYVDEDAGIERKYSQKNFLLEGVAVKQQYESNWRSLIKTLKEFNTFRVKDMSGAGEKQSFTGFAAYAQNNKGIIFAISFPFKIFGFKYAKMPDIPGSITYGQEFKYHPFDSEMQDYSDRIENCIQENFDGFSKFDNNCAEVKVRKIFIGGLLYQDLDLWNVLLSTYDQGLV